MVAVVMAVYVFGCVGVGRSVSAVDWVRERVSSVQGVLGNTPPWVSRDGGKRDENLHTYTHTYSHIHTHISPCMHSLCKPAQYAEGACVHTHAHVCVCVCVCVCVHVCVSHAPFHGLL